MSQLRAQITKLRPKGHIILTGDFNGKININQEEAKQSASRNGLKLEETLEDLQLTAISTKSKTGTWTSVPWNKKETKSVIDYIVIKKEDEKLVTDNIVDEAESIKIQGTNKSDHNTLCLALKIPHTNESTTITRWKLKNEEGWKYFNKELQKLETEGQLSYNQMEKSIKCILEKTIGKTWIKTNRPSRGKETETIKALRKDLREKRNAFNTVTRKNKNKHESMKAYIQSQAKLKEGIEKENRENIRDLAKRISKEGETKSQLFWKEKRRITPKQSSNSYITLNESGHPIEDPAEAKEHIAQYFENLYQAREGRPQYAEWTKEIKTTIKRITKSAEMKEDIDPILTTEITDAIHKLKNRKALHNCTTEHQTWQHKGNKNKRQHTPRGSAISPTIRTLDRRNKKKEITKENLGTHIESLDETIGCLLWMNDVLLISSEPNELQQMLNITSAIAGKYHVEFGEEKSNVMKIGRNKENPEFTLGDMNLKYTNKYKYLGYVQNNKNNLEDNIKATKAKVENTYQTQLAIAGNKNFSNIKMQLIWELTQSCITSTIAYSSEIWSPWKNENEKN